MRAEYDQRRKNLRLKHQDNTYTTQSRQIVLENWFCKMETYELIVLQKKKNKNKNKNKNKIKTIQMTH